MIWFSTKTPDFCTLLTAIAEFFTQHFAHVFPTVTPLIAVFQKTSGNEPLIEVFLGNTFRPHLDARQLYDLSNHLRVYASKTYGLFPKQNGLEIVCM